MFGRISWKMGKSTWFTPFFWWWKLEILPFLLLSFYQIIITYTTSWVISCSFLSIGKNHLNYRIIHLTGDFFFSGAGIWLWISVNLDRMSTKIGPLSWSFTHLHLFCFSKFIQKLFGTKKKNPAKSKIPHKFLEQFSSPFRNLYSFWFPDIASCSRQEFLLRYRVSDPATSIFKPRRRPKDRRIEHLGEHIGWEHWQVFGQQNLQMKPCFQHGNLFTTDWFE